MLTNEHYDINYNRKQKVHVNYDAQMFSESLITVSRSSSRCGNTGNPFLSVVLL